MKNVIPQQEVPALVVKTVNGMNWDLREEQPANFTLVVFYRGLHSPICKTYLEEINANIDRFRDNGINIICVSANDGNLAEQTVAQWGIEKLVIGYGFSIDAARKWDLYISKETSKKQPDTFFEPALFLVRPDNTLYAAFIQSSPFARPPIEELIKSIDYIVDNDVAASGAT